MGTKLKFIIGFFYLYLIILTASCAINRKSKLDGYVPKEHYITAYKTAFIWGCINEGSKGMLSQLSVENNDARLFTETEILSIPIAQEASSMGKAYSKTIQPIDYEDVAGKTPIVSTCIWYGMSKEVDKIAQKKYKEFIKGLGKKLVYIYEE